MPRRIVDGEGLWSSDKLARVKPEKYRAEFANLLPAALANGVFEASPARVWSTVYSFNRPDVSRNDVEKILVEFERVGLLFRWIDVNGKAWAFFVGSEKRGRLPAQSLRARYGVGPEPPAEKLAEYLQKNGSVPVDTEPDHKPVSSATHGKETRSTSLPEAFGISDEVREWAKGKGYTRLEEHLEHFVGLARAKDYKYSNWNQAFKNAVRDNWAKLDRPPVRSSGKSAVERAKEQLEAH